MNHINAPPPIKSMCGIDSLHIQVKCSIKDLFSFMQKHRYLLIQEGQTKWTTRFKIILPGEKVQVVMTKQGSCRLEFGGLHYSKNSKEKLQLIRSLTHAFPYFKVHRLDFACDFKILLKDLSIEAPEKYERYDRYQDSIYMNRKTKARTINWIAYDRGKRIKIFSFPLTRIELRLHASAVSNRKLQKCFHEEKAFRKCFMTIEKQFSSLKLKVAGKTVSGIEVDAKFVLENFIEFLHSDIDLPRSRDHFHIGEAIVAKDKLARWMKLSGTTWSNLQKRCKKRQKQVCKEVGISEPTLRKAIRVAKKFCEK